MTGQKAGWMGAADSVPSCCTGIFIHEIATVFIYILIYVLRVYLKNGEWFIGVMSPKVGVA